MDDELKRMVEAILFAAARKLELSEIAKLCKRSEDEIRAVLSEWRAELEASSSPTMLVEDGSAWKLTVREKYVSVIKKVVTKTELPKGHLETLAVVAYKAPVLQSKVVKIRTNKAYEHLSQLEHSGLITREKSGRTKLIKLTPKFFEYFDIDPSKLRQKFGSSSDVEKAIEAKELEIEALEVEQRKQAGERLETPQIVLHPDSGKPKELETYPAVQPDDLMPTGVELFLERMGDLEVFDVPLESIPPEERPVPEHPHNQHHKKKSKKKHSHAVHHKKEEAVEAEQTEVPAEVSASEVPEQAVKEEVPAETVEVPAEESPVEKVEKPKRKSKKEQPAEEIPEKAEEKVEEVLTPEQKIAKEAEAKTKKLKPRSFEQGKGLYPKGVPPEMEAKIEEKIKRLLSGEPEPEREESEEKKEE